MRALAISLNIALLVVIFLLGTMPSGPSVQDIPGKDKLGHALAFGALGGAQYWGLRVLELGKAELRPWLAALGATFFGGILEVVQIALPTRSAEMFDLLADGVGACLVAALIAALSRRRGAAQGDAARGARG
jgi:VanZ family protein